MRRSFFFLISLLLLVSCSSNEQTPEEQAGIAAKGYYDRLQAGDYEGFLKGKTGMDSLSSDYRIQMLAVFKQYKQELESIHGGVADVTVSNVRNDSLLQMMQVFLLLQFRDSTKEEIIVPMVQKNGEWKMR